MNGKSIIAFGGRWGAAAGRLICLALLGLQLAGYAIAVAQVQAGTPAAESGAGERPPEEALLEVLNVKDADLRDVFRGIAHRYGLNLVVDNRIDRKVTVRLANLPVIEAVRFLCMEHGLQLSQYHRIIRIALPPEPPPRTPPPPKVAVHDSLLTLDLQEEELGAVVRALAEQSGQNIMVRQGVQGTLTGVLREVPFEVGLRTLMAGNGFAVREQDGIFHIDRQGGGGMAGASGGRAFWVQVKEGRVQLDVAAAPIAEVLREVAAQMQANLVTYAVPEGTITARVGGLTLEEALNFLLRGTNITYRREGDVYFVGSKQTNGIASTRLVRLDHIRADGVLELIPEMIKTNANIQVVREHNGLMVTGTHDVIMELEHFVDEIDYPTPQILIEALVVDFTATDLFDLGIRFGRDEARAAAGSAYGFETAEGETRGLRHTGNGEEANSYLESLTAFTRLFGVHKIGRLPADFYFQIQALSRDGKANIRSRPQIATLNGHTASISIGTTQYYILSTHTPYQSPGQVYLQETERFERIEANVKLEITPWVSASGEVTTEIRPEFSTPVGELDPQVPPTINSRVLDSTVRLRDGETIILGGLIQDVASVEYDKVPVLGSLPLLGRLFRGQSRETTKAELVIFLTPHVFYGDERDAQKWQELQDRLDLSTLRQRQVGYTRLQQ